MNKQALKNECNMLQGNVNRIMVTNDRQELITMYLSALDRLETIFNTKYKNLINKRIELNIQRARNHMNSVYGIGGFVYADTDSIKVEQQDKNNERSDS